MYFRWIENGFDQSKVAKQNSVHFAVFLWGLGWNNVAVGSGYLKSENNVSVLSYIKLDPHPSILQNRHPRHQSSMAGLLLASLPAFSLWDVLGSGAEKLRTTRLWQTVKGLMCITVLSCKKAATGGAVWDGSRTYWAPSQRAQERRRSTVMMLAIKPSK